MGKMRKTVIISIILVLFITNCSSQTNKMTEEQYFAKSKLIWQYYVPKSGQSEFVQGELLRAVEKLRDEAHRNGNINFNEKCHEILIGFLREKLSDRKIFDEKTIEIINADLNRLSLEEQPYTWDDIFDRICNRIVDWNMYYGNEIEHQNNPELNC